MMVLPVAINDREFDLWIVLTPENLARMCQYDPAELVKANLGEPWTGMQIRNVMLTAVTDEEARELPARSRANLEGALRWLSRGFKYRPEAGDHDEPYENVLQRAEQKLSLVKQDKPQ